VVSDGNLITGQNNLSAEQVAKKAIEVINASNAATRVMLLVTSVKDLEGMGRDTGSWYQELAAPYYLFQEAGYTVDIVSPAGGAAPIDIGSRDDQWMTEFTRKFEADEAAQAALKGTLKLEDVDASTYDAILCVGGHGGYVDFVDNKVVDNAIETIDRKNGTVIAVCHGPLALFGAKKADGTPLVAGRTVTGFTNEEETQVGLADKMKFLIEDKLTELGGKYVKLDAWSDHVVSDGNLITGQNNLSAEQVAKKAIEVINAAKK
jgi:putative intracellular protease/amidase